MLFTRRLQNQIEQMHVFGETSLALEEALGRLRAQRAAEAAQPPFADAMTVQRVRATFRDIQALGQAYRPAQVIASRPPRRPRTPPPQNG